MRIPVITIASLLAAVLQPVAGSGYEPPPTLVERSVKPTRPVSRAGGGVVQRGQVE